MNHPVAKVTPLLIRQAGKIKIAQLSWFFASF